MLIVCSSAISQNVTQKVTSSDTLRADRGAYSIMNVYKKSEIEIRDYYDSCKSRLPDAVNRYQPTIIPVVTIDGSELYFDRKIHPENTAGIRDKDEIWLSRRLSTNVWSEPVNIGSPVNTPDSDVLFSISPDESKYLVYGNYSDNIGQKSPGFSITSKSAGKWMKPVPLKIKNFYNDTSNFFANLSADGRILLMAISRKDGFGNLDLYVSFRTDSGYSFSEPVNLGETVNTPGIEGSPFLAYDNKTLYFSSNGHKGFGKQDLFMTRRLDDSWKKWSKPVNLGKRINSKSDDTGIWLTVMSDGAYVVSSDTTVRRDGIYFVCIPDSLRSEPYVIVTGNIYGIKQNTPGNLKEKVRFEVNNDLNPDIDYYYSNPEKTQFYFTLPGGNQYNIFASCPDFEDVSFSISTRNLNLIKYINYDVILKQKKQGELLETVHFATNIDELAPDEKAKLSFIVNKVFTPKETKLRIIGHTDEVGSDADNMQLSIRRAEKTGKFLDELGFNLKNIKIIGKGKTQPISDKQEENRRAEVFLDE